MKRVLLCCCWMAAAVSVADEIPKSGRSEIQAEGTKPTEIKGWGEAVDPDRDCLFFRSEKALMIAVPGGGRPHDLAAEIDLTNAPRVVQPVRGDFTIEVRIDGRFEPGAESTKPGRTPYNGAALIVMFDSQNVVTLARAALEAGGEIHAYANFEMRIDGQVDEIGSYADHPLPKTGPVYLRLERQGTDLTASVSTDGKDWREIDTKEIPQDWPAELQVGVEAISTSGQEFDPRFSELRLGD